MDTTKQEDEIFSFFDDIYGSIPKQYKKEDVQMEIGEEETPARSLFEIGDLATAKIKAEQKANAQKSVAKIKEITKKHVQKKKDEPEAGSEDDVEMGSIDFQDEETEKKGKAGKEG